MELFNRKFLNMYALPQKSTDIQTATNKIFAIPLGGDKV